MIIDGWSDELILFDGRFFVDCWIWCLMPHPIWQVTIWNVHTHVWYQNKNWYERKVADFWTGRRTVSIQVWDETYKFRFQNVLHVPEFDYSVISVSTLHGKGLIKTFGNMHCVPENWERTLVTRNWQGNLHATGKQNSFQWVAASTISFLVHGLKVLPMSMNLESCRCQEG